MKVPISWLKEYVPVSIPARELAHRLTMAGLEVAEASAIGESWDKIFVGLVTRVERHPNADRLVLTTVDIGSETITVVCGAPNVAQGQKVPFAREGARLFDPRTGQPQILQAARIRGVLSEGMVCSERELGLGDDHEGIVVLEADAPVGMPLADYLGDVILEMEPTPNRPDWLSVLGVAHEVAALTGSSVKEPDVEYPEDGEPIEGLVNIQVADPRLCPRYTASIITGVRVGPSPRWLQERLLKAGQRPINNVVDITNYVMLEFGQPLHAFDYHALKDKTIIIRQARRGEVVQTLDGVERELGPPVLVIADSADAIALAGVMGGASSEITETTTDILLESANFNPANNRQTSAALKLRTEASVRFEKGLRPELASIGLRRATQLILQIAGGKAARGIMDVYPGRQEPPPVEISLERLKKVLGHELSLEEVQKVLSSLGFEKVEGTPSEKATSLSVNVPYWRSDITIEDDLVEEVARITGYDRIPTTMLSSSVPQYQPQPLQELREQVRDILASCGMQEIISYPLTSLEALEKVEALRNRPRPLRVTNPLSSEMEYLRTTLKGSLLMTLAANLRRREEGIRLFEVGRVYLPRVKDLPEERETLAGVVAGARAPTSWATQNWEMGFFDAKGILEALFGRLGASVAYEPIGDPVLHPGRSARVVLGQATLGVVGEVHPKVLGRFDIEGVSVGLFDIDLEALHGSLTSPTERFQDFTRFPSSTRDMAILVDEKTPSARIQGIIERHALVAHTTVFDVYTGEGIPPGKKSLGYRMVFQSPTGTLTAEQVNAALEDILRSLETEVGAQLRG